MGCGLVEEKCIGIKKKFEKMGLGTKWEKKCLYQNMTSPLLIVK